MKRKIFSIITLFVVLFAVTLCFVACSPKAEGEGTIKVEVVNIAAEKVYEKSYKFKKGDTLLALLRADNNLKLVTEDLGSGAFITSVYGISQETGVASGKYWMIYINDKASTAGISQVQLIDGNVIRLAIEEMSW